MKLIVIGALLLVPGLLSYTRAWRSRPSSPVPHWPFGVGALLWCTSAPVTDVL